MTERIQKHVDVIGFLKILIPDFAVGAIIGPKGRNILMLQEQTKTKVEMSRKGDNYPGTNERICLISGKKEDILQVLGFMTKVILQKPYTDPVPCIDFCNKKLYGRGNQVKILVPNKIASRVIGIGGKKIKGIIAKSGSYVQISQFSPDITLYERCITVMGHRQNNTYACRLLLEIISEDKEMERFLHISYTHITHYIPNSNPIGSPVVENREIPDCARHEDKDFSSHSLTNDSIWHSIRAPSSPIINMVPRLLQTEPMNPSNMARDSFPHVAVDTNNMPQFSFPSAPFLDFMRRNSLTPLNIAEIVGYLSLFFQNPPLPEAVLAHITQALSTLSNYGVLEICFHILSANFNSDHPFWRFIINDSMLLCPSLSPAANTGYESGEGMTGLHYTNMLNNLNRRQSFYNSEFNIGLSFDSGAANFSSDGYAEGDGSTMSFDVVSQLPAVSSRIPDVSTSAASSSVSPSCQRHNSH